MFSPNVSAALILASACTYRYAYFTDFYVVNVSLPSPWACHLVVVGEARASQ